MSLTWLCPVSKAICLTQDNAYESIAHSRVPFRSSMEYHTGSILGPLLFNLYVNDLPSVCNTSAVESYVDDSKLDISFSNKDVNGGLEDFRLDLNRVASWCRENRLLINPEKTKFCVFGSNKMLAQMSIPPIMFLLTLPRTSE